MAITFLKDTETIFKLRNFISYGELNPERKHLHKRKYYSDNKLPKSILSQINNKNFKKTKK